ncbi:YciI family protein [Sulfitobacter aestuarii]|uniref:YciI family protein n=1 Tax=Sulfitobacter aestuarii TaxID=2161676 RepID=A0ABW5U9W7_9RHOB
MLVALIARDKPGAQEIRSANRPAHLDYLKASDHVAQAGPLLDAEGGMIGSLLILDVPDMAVARDWAANDPYAAAGLFSDVQLVEWKRVIG